MAAIISKNYEQSTYNNDPDVFYIFRSEELAKILRRALLM